MARKVRFVLVPEHNRASHTMAIRSSGQICTFRFLMETNVAVVAVINGGKGVTEPQERSMCIVARQAHHHASGVVFDCDPTLREYLPMLQATVQEQLELFNGYSYGRA